MSCRESTMGIVEERGWGWGLGVGAILPSGKSSCAHTASEYHTGHSWGWFCPSGNLWQCLVPLLLITWGGSAPDL